MLEYQVNLKYCSICKRVVKMNIEKKINEKKQLHTYILNPSRTSP